MSNLIVLTKGANISLDKTAPGLRTLAANLVWEKRATDGVDFDLDSSVFMLTDSGQVQDAAHFIFYHNKQSPCGGVSHGGDNTTGGGDGETIHFDLDKIPAHIAKLVITITIHEADKRGQTFGQVENAGVRLSNPATGEDIASYSLSEDYSTETAMVMCEIYRHDGEWKFKAVGQGYAGGLAALCNRFGIQAG